MTTAVTAELAFNASPARVWAMLTSSDYADFKRATVGDFDLDIAQLGSRTVLTFTRPVTAELTAAATAFMGTSPLITEVQEWEEAGPDDSRFAHITISVAQAPATITGTASLAADNSGSLVTIDLSISVAIPLFGGTAEQFIKKELEKHIEAERELGASWLDK